VRGLASEIIDDLEVLAAGVEDLQHILVGDKQLEQGREVEAVCLWIDRRRFFLIADLDQAKIWPIGVLAHEFGVDGYEV
jgi:hypothetical protein